MGTRRNLRKPQKHTEDHPHACGDKLSVSTGRNLMTGSSPRVWGQVRALSQSAVQSGIIPTRVGTSRMRLSRSENTQDHPHACGDKEAPPRAFTRLTGSSPRVWGQAVKGVVADNNARIIPTRVGTRFHQC